MVEWHIYVVEPPIDEAALKCMFHSHIGHELEDTDYQCPEAPAIGMCRHRWDIIKGENVMVGSKHWLYHWATGAAPDELPEPVTEIINTFKDFDPVTPELVGKVKECYELPSTRMFEMDGLEECREKMIEFLERNMGKKIFARGL